MSKFPLKIWRWLKGVDYHIPNLRNPRRKRIVRRRTNGHCMHWLERRKRNRWSNHSSFTTVRIWIHEWIWRRQSFSWQEVNQVLECLHQTITYHLTWWINHPTVDNQLITSWHPIRWALVKHGHGKDKRSIDHSSGQTSHQNRNQSSYQKWWMNGKLFLK